MIFGTGKRPARFLALGSSQARERESIGFKLSA